MGLAVALLHAVGDGALTSIRALLNQKADIDSNCYCNKLLLHAAIKAGNTDVVDLLLVNKANVLATDSLELSPLNTAIQAGNVEAAQLLLDHKADVQDSCTFLLCGVRRDAIHAARQTEALQESAESKQELEQERDTFVAYNSVGLIVLTGLLCFLLIPIIIGLIQSCKVHIGPDYSFRRFLCLKIRMTAAEQISTAGNDPVGLIGGGGHAAIRRSIFSYLAPSSQIFSGDEKSLATQS